MYYTRDTHKWVMFANYTFANSTSFSKFTKILSHENLQVHGMSVHACMCVCVDALLINVQWAGFAL